MQRSISFQQSFILLCLGFAFWLSAQKLLLSRIGLEPPTSIQPGAIAPVRGAVAAPARLRNQPDRRLLSRLGQQPHFAALLAAAQWSRFGGAGAAAVLLLGESQPLAKVPEAKDDMGRVVIDLSDRKVYLYASQDSKIAAAQYDIAIGQDGWETPPGRYLIEAMQTKPTWQHPITHEIVPPGEDNPLGAAWISFLTTQDYSLGLHGTNDESLVGQAVSHGCIRMRNDDILALYSKVDLGWPLDVRP